MTTPTPAEQAARIKELAEQYSDAVADSKASPWLGRLAALQKALQEELHTAIDSLAAECERLQALAAMESARLDWIDQNAECGFSGKIFSVRCECYIGEPEARNLRAIVDNAMQAAKQHSASAEVVK